MYFIFLCQCHILTYRKETSNAENTIGSSGFTLRAEEFKMKRVQKNRRELLHYNMALIGGISGAYALLVRGGNFGAAETTNLIELTLDCAELNGPDILIRLSIFLLYSSSIILAHLIGLRFSNRKYQICLLVEGICVFSAGLIPTTVNPLVALYPIFIMSAFQWKIFTDADVYNSSTIFSTNNLKQTLVSWTNYRLEGDSGQKKKAVFFARTLAVFHIGVLLGWLFVRLWDERGIWLAFLLFASAFYCASLCREPNSQTANVPETPGIRQKG